MLGTQYAYHYDQEETHCCISSKPDNDCHLAPIAHRQLRQRERLLSGDSEALSNEYVWRGIVIIPLLVRHGSVREASRTGRGFVRHV